MLSEDMLKENFFSHFWVRPETALWRSLDALALNRLCPEFESGLDLGCGDGIFSFLAAGGIRQDADVVTDLGSMAGYFDNVDVFDSRSRIDIPVKKPACRNFKVGLDAKRNLLDKASRLGIYDEMVESDANAKWSRSLPQFDFVFSNIIYWLNQPLVALEEVYRSLRLGGCGIFFLPVNEFRDSQVLNSTPWSIAPLKEFSETIDRGRFTTNFKSLFSRDRWLKEVEKIGFSIELIEPHLSKEVLQVWDIGSRLFFPQIVRLIKACDPEEVSLIKADVVSEWLRISGPLFEYENSKPLNTGFIVLKVRKDR